MYRQVMAAMSLAKDMCAEILSDPHAAQVAATAQVLHPTPHTLHLTPCTLHPTPYTLHPTPYTLHTAQ